MMLLKNKKGFSEITSFVLLTLLIITSSTVAYLFSNNFLSDKISEMDLKKAEVFLKNLNVVLTDIKSFDSNTRSVAINFNSGELKFNADSLEYFSSVKYSGSLNCFNDLCYDSYGGYEKIFINLSDGYLFNKNISLSPGYYIITFRHLKNISRIDVEIK